MFNYILKSNPTYEIAVEMMFNHSTERGRVVTIVTALLLLVSQSQYVSAQVPTSSCTEEENACLTRCGGKGKYDFDCNDSGEGARAFSCSCSGTGNGWATTVNDIPQEYIGANDTQCAQERSSCSKSCPQGTVSKFECKHEKQEGSFSLATACACVAGNTSSPVQEDHVNEIIPANSSQESDSTIPKQNGDTCEQKKKACETTCPRGTVPDFNCENNARPDGSSFSISSACACVSPSSESKQTVQPTGNQSANLQSDGSDVPTSSGFTAGANFVIQYIMASLLMLEALVQGDE